MATIVPMSEGGAVTSVPLLLGTGHRLLVTGPHDDSPLVCKQGVLRIIFAKSVVPHGRQQVVGLQSE